MTASEGISVEELQLAARNHGMPLEALRYDVTPAGLHYLLIHYDIPVVDPETFLPPIDFRRDVLVAGAVRIGRTRLIDNVRVYHRRS